MFGWNGSTSSEEYVGLMDELVALDHIMSSMSYSLPPHIPYTKNMTSNSYCHRINEGLSDVIRRPSISDLSSSGQLMSVPDMIDDAWHQSPMVILPTGRSTLDLLAAFLRAYGLIKKT
jgi:hypothetical protein